MRLTPYTFPRCRPSTWTALWTRGPGWSGSTSLQPAGMARCMVNCSRLAFLTPSTGLFFISKFTLGSILPPRCVGWPCWCPPQGMGSHLSDHPHWMRLAGTHWAPKAKKHCFLFFSKTCHYKRKRKKIIPHEVCLFHLPQYTLDCGSPITAMAVGKNHVLTGHTNAKVTTTSWRSTKAALLTGPGRFTSGTR